MTANPAIAAWSERYNALCDRRDRIAEMIRDRADIESRKAGLGELNMCSLHNSLISLSEGKPWREVDYKHARRAKWLLDNQWKASRIVDRWYQRTWKELCRREFGYKGA